MRAALISALAAGLAACSFGVNRAPATLNADAPPKCTTSMALPGIDLAVAGAAGLGALAADDGGRGVLLGTGALFGLAGLLGTVWVKDCKRKVAAHHMPEYLTAKETTGPEPEPEPEPPPEPEPEPGPELAGELEARVDFAPSSGAAPAACPKGASCPAGLKCDPLRHRCVGAAELGTENQRCAAKGRCDLGLYCDLDRQICLPGDLGLEGGACQSGERCAPGLVCRSGLCVQNKATSAGSTRRPRAPRRSPGDEPAPPDRP